MSGEFFQITIRIKTQNEENLRDACERNGVYIEDDFDQSCDSDEAPYKLRSEYATSLFLAGVEYGKLTKE